MLAIREAFENYRQETGKRLSAHEAVSSYLVAVKMFPDNLALTDAVR